MSRVTHSEPGLPMAGPSLVGFLSQYSDILSGSLCSGILCEIASDLFVFSFQDCFVNIIRARV